MSPWIGIGLGLAVAIGVIGWLQHLLRKLRRDLSVDEPRVSSRWLDERLRNRR
jgi:hypothetical protein